MPKWNEVRIVNREQAPTIGSVQDPLVLWKVKLNDKIAEDYFSDAFGVVRATTDRYLGETAVDMTLDQKTSFREKIGVQGDYTHLYFNASLKQKDEDGYVRITTEEIKETGKVGYPDGSTSVGVESLNGCAVYLFSNKAEKVKFKIVYNSPYVSFVLITKPSTSGRVVVVETEERPAEGQSVFDFSANESEEEVNNPAIYVVGTLFQSPNRHRVFATMLSARNPLNVGSLSAPSTYPEFWVKHSDTVPVGYKQQGFFKISTLPEVWNDTEKIQDVKVLNAQNFTANETCFMELELVERKPDGAPVFVIKIDKVT